MSDTVGAMARVAAILDVIDTGQTARKGADR